MGLSLAAHLLSEPIRSGYSKLLFCVTIDRHVQQVEAEEKLLRSSWLQPL